MVGLQSWLRTREAGNILGQEAQAAQSHGSSSGAEVEEKTWLPIPCSNPESSVLRADTRIFPLGFNPCKHMGFFLCF